MFETARVHLLRLPSPVLTGAGSRVCGSPHSQRPRCDPGRSPVGRHNTNLTVVPPSARSPTVNAQTLLGRDDVMSRVDALLASCRAGRGGLLWVHGDAGIGKTRV